MESSISCSQDRNFDPHCPPNMSHIPSNTCEGLLLHTVVNSFYRFPPIITYSRCDPVQYSMALTLQENRIHHQLAPTLQMYEVFVLHSKCFVYGECFHRGRYGWRPLTMSNGNPSSLINWKHNRAAYTQTHMKRAWTNGKKALIKSPRLSPHCGYMPSWACNQTETFMWTSCLLSTRHNRCTLDCQKLFEIDFDFNGHDSFQAASELKRRFKKLSLHVLMSQSWSEKQIWNLTLATLLHYWPQLKKKNNYSDERLTSLCVCM